jgi:hypothetical protein
VRVREFFVVPTGSAFVGCALRGVALTRCQATGSQSSHFLHSYSLLATTVREFNPSL